jgi:hypothetical protein
MGVCSWFCARAYLSLLKVIWGMIKYVFVLRWIVRESICTENLEDFSSTYSSNVTLASTESWLGRLKTFLLSSTTKTVTAMCKTHIYVYAYVSVAQLIGVLSRRYALTLM